MGKRCLLSGLLAGCGALAAAPALAGSIVLTVGPGGAYDTISGAVAVADADPDLGHYYDVRVQPGTYVNDFPRVSRPLTIEADPGFAGRPVVLKAIEPLPNKKGIILTVASLTVNGLTFTGAKIANADGGNAAGIRDLNAGPAARLVVLNSTFTGNQEGILTGNDAGETIAVVNSKFVNNGNPDIGFFQHGLYVNKAASLSVTNSLFCGQLIGHDIKSRAAVTTVDNNRLYAGAGDDALGCRAGSTSFAVDAPNGGAVTLSGNRLVQGAAAQNHKMVAYGEEGLAYRANSFLVSNNSFASSGLANATAISDPHCVTVQLRNNTFAGFATIVDPPGCAVFR